MLLPLKMDELMDDTRIPEWWRNSNGPVPRE
jgi:hypothetical protein